MHATLLSYHKFEHCCFVSFCYVFVFLAFFGSDSSCFNLDVENRKIFIGPIGSRFGHAVDFYRREKEKLGHVLAGAPSGKSESQPDIERGGAVYWCGLDSGDCRDMQMDTQGNTWNASKGAYQDSKNNQQLGATLTSSTNGNRILACAPLYNYIQNFVKVPALNISLAVGNCFLGSADNATSGSGGAREISPIRYLIRHETVSHRIRHYDKLGGGLLGFAAATPHENMESLYLTMPGAWYFEGGLLRQGLGLQSDIKYTKEMERGSIEDDSIVGYSVAAGDFSDRGSIDLALGAPRAKKLSGAVLVYGQKLNLLRVLEGRDTGAYFGASVALGHVNGDDLQDLIVGAPLYSQRRGSELGRTSSAQSKFEVGRVYIYLQTDAHQFQDRSPLILEGKDEWGRFGTAVAFAGDLNGDYYGDVVVGAPWAGKDGRGVLYVYHGNKDTGINPTAVQSIPASTVDRALHAFGWSLAANRDMDDNGFPDVLVGAPDSNRAVLLMTRPIVKLLEANFKGISSVDLSKSLCLVNSSTICNNPVLELCISFTSKGVLQTVIIDADVTLDAAKVLSDQDARAYFVGTETYKKTITFNSGKGEIPECKKISFEISKKIVDKLNPIVVVANFTVGSSNRGGAIGLQPVLSIYGKTQSIRKIQLSKNCGQGKACVPDLSISGGLQICKMRPLQGDRKCAKAESFTSNTDEIMDLRLTIENKGADSFVTKLTIILGPGIVMDEYSKPPGSPGPPVHCDPQISYEVSDPSFGIGVIDGAGKVKMQTKINITCDIGNPLQGQTKNEIQFYLSLADKSDPTEKIDVSAVVSSMNNESASTLSDNVISWSLPVIRRPDLRLLSTSFPANQFYSRSDFKPREQIKWTGEIGPNVTHIYQIQNDGYLTIEEAQLDIYWPLSMTEKNSDGSKKYLLYLSDEPRIVGSPGACSVSGAPLNPENLKNDYGYSDTNEAAPPDVEAIPGLAGVDVERPLNDTKGKNPSRIRRSTGVEHEYLPVSSSDSRLNFPGIPNLINKAQQFINAPTGSDMPNLDAICQSERPGCVRISCTLGPIRPQSYGVVQISGWLWMNTLVQDKFFDAEIRSVGVLTTVKFGGRQSRAREDRMSLMAMAILAVDPKDPTAFAKPIQWWIYALAAVIGLFLLLIIFLLLRKCGFFKRLKHQLGDGEEEVVATEMATLMTKEENEELSSPTHFGGYKDTPASPGGRYKWQDEPLGMNAMKTPLSAFERNEDSPKFGFNEVL